MEDGTLACCWRPFLFYNAAAGGRIEWTVQLCMAWYDGLAADYWSGEANNVVIYNQSLPLSLAGSAMRECAHVSVLLWSFLLMPLAFIATSVIDFKIPRGFIASNSIASFRNVTTYP